MSIRRRDFPEVLDALLTTLGGGVAAEEHAFPPAALPGPEVFEHRLEQPPASEVVSVYGTRNGVAHAFRNGIDYVLADDGAALAWTTEAQLPDAGTLLSVSYATAPSRSELTDLSTGSVVRTLAESTALEIARLYAQLDAVYRAGFIDTATDESLDHVVALLGVERVRGGRPTGEVEFVRVPGGRGAITLPAGTRVVTADGAVEYATTATVTLADRQSAVRVTARDVEPNDPVGAGALNVLSVPVAGIASVANPAPTVRSVIDESDAELRARTKAFLGGSERATLGALKGAIAHQQITADVEEAEPGRIVVTPHMAALPPELEQRLLAAIENARPAGVLVELRPPVAPDVLELQLRLTTLPNLVERELLAAHDVVRAAVADFFERLPIREPASVNRIVGLALAVDGVEDVRILGARIGGQTPTDVLDLARGELRLAGLAVVLGDLRIADPALPTLLSAKVTIPAAVGLDANALAPALSLEIAVINAEGSSGESVVPSVSYERLRQALALPAPEEAFGVVFAFTQRSGLSRLLSSHGESYARMPFERLTLTSLTWGYGSGA